jgi:hypothetical protein
VTGRSLGADDYLPKPFRFPGTRPAHPLRPGRFRDGLNGV